MGSTTNQGGNTNIKLLERKSLEELRLKSLGGMALKASWTPALDGVMRIRQRKSPQEPRCAHMGEMSCSAAMCKTNN